MRSKAGHHPTSCSRNRRATWDAPSPPSRPIRSGPASIRCPSAAASWRASTASPISTAAAPTCGASWRTAKRASTRRTTTTLDPTRTTVLFVEHAARTIVLTGAVVLVMRDKTTRDQIVAAADQLFYRRGFEHTSFSDIADAVRISRGNFYHHFKSKDDILDAVIGARL